MFAVIVNAVAIIVGSLIGLLFKKGIPQKITTPITNGLSLCVLYIGISGALCGENVLISIASLVIGVVIGTLLDIDGKFNSLGDRLENKFSGDGEKGNFSKGFVNASILFGVGAMAIVGSINAGLTRDYSVLFTKSLLDAISSVIFASTFGIGVMFSAITIFVYQGLICLLAQFLSPVLTQTAINEMSCVGYILIIGMGLNMLNVTKIKIADYMPAIVIAPIIVYLISLF